MSIQIRRLSHAIGAEISGVNIQEPLDDKSRSEIYSAFLEYCVLVFRGQSLTRAQYVEFSRCFGEVDKNKVILRDGVEGTRRFHMCSISPRRMGSLPV